MTAPLASLRGRAEALAAPLPPLLADAERLASHVMLGIHGRRRAGRGDEFWQYRPAHPGDEAKAIDWRRSARSDTHFIREKEWQAAQSVWLWADPGRSMDFTSSRGLPTKRDRARVLVLAMAILLERGGERFGLAGPDGLSPRAGRAQVELMAGHLSRMTSAADYSMAELGTISAHGRVMLVSDFLSDISTLKDAVLHSAARGLRGVLLQVTDPQEETFPFRGRTIFRSIGGSIEHETLKAGSLRDAYLARMQSRRDELAALARQTGWLCHAVRTDEPAQAALLWAFRALEPRR